MNPNSKIYQPEDEQPDWQEYVNFIPKSSNPSKDKSESSLIEKLAISSSINISNMFDNAKVELPPISQMDTEFNDMTDVPVGGFIREASFPIQYKNTLKIDSGEICELSVMGHHIHVRHTEAGMSFTLLKEDTQYFLEPGKKLSLAFDGDNNLVTVPLERSAIDLSSNGNDLFVTVQDVDFFVSHSSFDPLKYKDKSFEKLPELEKQFVLSHRHTLSLECLQAFRDNAMLEADIDGLPTRIYRGYRLGAGGFGKVFNGFYCRDGRLHQCVIKEGVPHPDFTKFFTYERERAQDLKTMRESEPDDYPPSLLKILAVTENHIVMDKCYHSRYGSMDMVNYILTDDYSKLSMSKQIDPLIDAAEALHYLHKKRYIHFDVKLPNIMIAQHGAVLVDFGLLSSMDDKTRQKYIFYKKENSFCGTKFYSDMKLDKQRNVYNDIYAFGKTINEVFSLLCKEDPDALRWRPWKILIKMCTNVNEEGHLVIDSFDRILDLLSQMKVEGIKYDQASKLKKN